MFSKIDDILNLRAFAVLLLMLANGLAGLPLLKGLRQNSR